MIHMHNAQSHIEVFLYENSISKLHSYNSPNVEISKSAHSKN